MNNYQKLNSYCTLIDSIISNIARDFGVLFVSELDFDNYGLQLTITGPASLKIASQFDRTVEEFLGDVRVLAWTMSRIYSDFKYSSLVDAGCKANWAKCEACYLAIEEIDELVGFGPDADQ